MNTCKFSLPLVLALSLTHFCSFAKVYSTVIKVESIGSFSDCYNVTYELFEDHNNFNPLDDSPIGSFNAIIGSDCKGFDEIKIEFIQDPTLMPHTKNVICCKDGSIYWPPEGQWISLREFQTRYQLLKEKNNLKLAAYTLTDIPNAVPYTAVAVQKCNTD